MRNPRFLLRVSVVLVGEVLLAPSILALGRTRFSGEALALQNRWRQAALRWIFPEFGPYD